MGGRTRRWTSRLAVVSGLAALGGIGYFYAGNLRTSRAVDERIAGLRQQVGSLEQEQVHLDELLKYFDSDAYAEEKARLEFGLAKPGEAVVVVPESRVEPSSRPRSSSSNVVRWWRYFFTDSKE